MSADVIRERYDAVPYRHGAVADSHSARIGAIARLLAISAAPPDRCRVLELGCGEGMNLLPIAERFPKSEFVGVDFSAHQIATAEAARAACGIDNARFVCADLRTWKPEGGAFDYIIAHGVYSWVPAEVRERLLVLCAEAMSPNGVAYVSYNTLPGWGLPGGVRKFLLSEIGAITSPDAQMARAVQVLDSLAACMKDQPGSYAANLRDTLDDMRAKQPGLLFHDELAAVNEPCTFTEFTAYAARHGLHYIAEAHYATMQSAHLPAPMHAALAPLQLDFVRTQQFMDVLFQRWLRNSLLSRAPVAPDRAIRPGVLADCAFGLRMTVDAGSINLTPGHAMRFTGIHGLVLEAREPVEKAVLTVLASAFPERLPFPAVCAKMNQSLAEWGLPPAQDFSALHEFLHRLFALDALDVMLCGDGEWLKTAGTPRLSPLMHYQAEHDLPLTNRWHEPVALTPEGKRALIDPAAHPDETALARAGLLV
jgi:SAM-dependent methyltransferase/methyltransferase-like protein